MTTVVTVTPNPSVDRTIELGRLARGEVLRADAHRLDAGGKGVNVARALVANGTAARAVLPLGGPDGRLLAGLLEEDGTPFTPVPVAGDTRSNVTIAERDGTITKLNLPGHHLTPAEVDGLIAAATADLAGVAWVVGCGSLPPGAPDDFYATLTRAARAGGAKVAIDTSGPPLAAAWRARPDVVKPNRHELEELVGRRLDGVDDVVDAARALLPHGPEVILVSLGADGAVLVTADEAVHAQPPPIVLRSDVGAGDSALAGFLAAGGQGPDALRAAVAWGAASASLPGTSVPRPDDIQLPATEIRSAS